MKQYLEKAFDVGLFGYALFLPFSISGAQGALGLLMATWLVYGITQKQSGYKFKIIDPLIIFFLVWVVIAVFFSVHPTVALDHLKRYWIFIGYFAVGRACMNRDRAEKALRILIISAGIVAIYGICQHFFGNAVPRYFAPKVNLYQKTGGYFHAVGLFDHHLTYGNSLLLIVLSGIGVTASMGFRKKAIPYALAVALGCGALVYSYARSAWMGFAAGVMFFALQLGKKVLVPAGIALGAILAIAMVMSPSLNHRIQSMVSVSSNLERIVTWKTTVDMIEDYPVFGIGRGNYRRVAPQYRSGYNVHWTASSHAHNSYLQFGVESGIPAMIAIGLLLVLLIRWAVQASVKIRGQRRLILYGLISAHGAFCVSSVFQHNLGDAEVAMTWFLIVAATFAVGDSSEVLTNGTNSSKEEIHAQKQG